MNKPKINLNFDKAFNYARKGIRRAACFAGIVLNEENSFNIKSFHIKEEFRLIPDKIDNAEVMLEFRNFVVKNALREMMELFDQTLINVFEMLNITKKFLDKVDFSETKKETEVFKWKNFPNKLKKIDNMLNNKLSRQKDYWQALQDIRNCITHYVSIVHLDEININIPRFFMIVNDKESGKEFVFPMGKVVEPTKISEGSEISFKIENIKKNFKKGEVISFTNEEVVYLIFGMIQSLAIFEKVVLENALGSNIPIIDKSTNKTFKTINELNKFRESQKRKI